jgi:hypothetical protein
MFRRLRDWQGVVADYTIGTAIVMFHMMTAARQDRFALPSPRR